MREAAAKPHYHGHRERLRARFREQGAAALADYELLEMALFRALPRRDTKPLAKALLKQFGSLSEVLAASPQRLREFDGVGDAVIDDLKLMRAIVERTASEAVRKRPVLSSWSTLIDYCRAAMAFEEREQFRILFLDKRNALIADEVQGTGTVDHTPVYPREVIPRPRIVGECADPRAQSSLRRPDTFPRRHPDDGDHRRSRQAPRHQRP